MTIGKLLRVCTTCIVCQSVSYTTGHVELLLRLMLLVQAVYCSIHRWMTPDWLLNGDISNSTTIKQRLAFVLTFICLLCCSFLLPLDDHRLSMLLRRYCKCSLTFIDAVFWDVDVHPSLNGSTLNVLQLLDGLLAHMLQLADMIIHIGNFHLTSCSGAPRRNLKQLSASMPASAAAYMHGSPETCWSG